MFVEFASEGLLKLFCRNKEKRNEELTVHVFSLQFCWGKQKKSKKRNEIVYAYDLLRVALQSTWQ